MSTLGRVFAALAALALGLGLVGCTAETRWGHEAVYAPDLRAYVIARPKPPTLAGPMPIGDRDVSRRIVLLDPVTGDKIRCREALTAALGPTTRAAATAIDDEDSTWKVTLPIALAMPTSYGASILGVYIGGPLLAVTGGVERLAGAPTSAALYADGKRALREQRYADAEHLFERSLAKSGAWFNANLADGPQRASLYLGALYQREGRDQEATRALLHFIRRAEIRDAAAYDDAERRLRRLAPTALGPCLSQAPASFAWPAPGSTPRR